MESQPKYMLNTRQQAKPSGDLLIVEIGNPSGFQQFSTTRTDKARADFLTAVMQALNSKLPESARVDEATIRTYSARATATLNNNNPPQRFAVQPFRTVVAVCCQAVLAAAVTTTARFQLMYATDLLLA
jgi:hypothetical protein